MTPRADRPRGRRPQAVLRWLLVAVAILLCPACPLFPGPDPDSVIPNRELDLLVIAEEGFIGALQALKAHKEAIGIRTHLVSWQSLDAAYDALGRDQPERIKRALAAFEKETGIQYVMLVGDSDAFPVRYCLASHTEWGSKHYPSDLYYADLYDAAGAFDDWDGNGNGVFCETDFAGGEDFHAVNVDALHLLPDLMVGRVPASTVAEVTTYVDKVVRYESGGSTDGWFQRALLVVDGGSTPFGDEAKMDALGATLDGFTLLKRYRDEAPYAQMSDAGRATALNVDLNEGVGLVFYHGHGNRLSWSGWYGHGNLAALSNASRLPVVFASACYTGRFHFDLEFYRTAAGTNWNRLAGPAPAIDHPLPMPLQGAMHDAHAGESLAEHFLVRQDAGSIAYIGSVSKVEHGVWVAPGEGLAHYFADAYLDGVALGAMWNDAVHAFITLEVIPKAMGWYRYIHVHKMMLFGDPSLRVGADAAVTVTVSPVEVTVSPGADQVFTAALSGTSDTAVTWSASAGTITGSGAIVTYTAPMTPGDQSVTVTSVADPSKSATAVVHVVAVPPRARDSEDPTGQLHTAIIEGATVARYFATEIPDEAYGFVPFGGKDTPEDRTERDPPKLHPLIVHWLDTRDHRERERIVIHFVDPVPIPRFPEPFIEEARDSPANRELLDQAAGLINNVRRARAAYYAALGSQLEFAFDAEVVETFWIVHALLVDIPIGAVTDIVGRADVLSIEPDRTQDLPPQNAIPGDDVAAGRALIRTDPYYDAGLVGGYIGLLDSGVRRTHTQFASPSNLDYWRDCVNGTGGNCTTPAASQNPNDDCWNHGTSSAGVISGNANSGTRFRGVTGVTLDSFKVYPTGTNEAGHCSGGLSTSATLRAFEAAVAVLDRVIVAEIQGGGGHNSAISLAADHAFDAGAVVIAANGNQGPVAGTVNSPANAHKVIGVGNVDVQALTQVASQSRGPTSDARFKPDVQAPTHTETASNGCPFGHGTTCTSFSDTALTVFGGTSGATPYAAGAAALLRNWMRGASFSIDPGQVYAQLILAAQSPYPFDNTRGAGLLRLPTNGYVWWGKVTVQHGQSVDIELHVGWSTPPKEFDAALWWPEDATQAHADVDLLLYDPSGALRATSESVVSVFERARATGTLTTGTWTLRLRGYDVPAGSQTVYVAAAALR